MIEVLRRVIQIDQLLDVTRRDVQDAAKQYFLQWTEKKQEQL